MQQTGLVLRQYKNNAGYLNRDPRFGQNEEANISSEDPFSLKGDSGAFILGLKEPASSVAGMIIGGHVDKGWTYVTPMGTLIKDIEERTGCKVRLPA